MTEMEIALAELKAIIEDTMTGKVAEMQTEIYRIAERFSRQIMIIETVQFVALGFAVLALVLLIVREVKHGKHSR